MGNPTTNCTNCGRPVWGEESYCSRQCETEDLPGALAEGCGKILALMIIGVILWTIVGLLFYLDPMGVL